MCKRILQLFKNLIVRTVFRLSENAVRKQLDFRTELPVLEKVVYSGQTMSDVGYEYPICPKCRTSLEREYVNYCDRCGQHLGWSEYDNYASIIKFVA